MSQWDDLRKKVTKGGASLSYGEMLTLIDAAERAERLENALDVLVIDANRLCDRQLGGTYEEDCRRAIAGARAALKGGQ